jgi:hypothetical protein
MATNKTLARGTRETPLAAVYAVSPELDGIWVKRLGFDGKVISKTGPFSSREIADKAVAHFLGQR